MISPKYANVPGEKKSFSSSVENNGPFFYYIEIKMMWKMSFIFGEKKTEENV